MTLTLDTAVVYDMECLPNVTTLTYEPLYHDDTPITFEISEYRDDRAYLFNWLNHLASHQTAMIGFFSMKYDYPLLHFLRNHPNVSYADIYTKSQELIKNRDNFANMIWDRDRFTPQIDLASVHHFDNVAKTTSLKALEVNMRSPVVRESRLPFDQPASKHDIDTELVPYNIVDVKETKRFAFYSMAALEFRLGLVDQFGVEVLNYNDVKIGVKMLEKRLGDDVCYTREPFIDKFGNERSRRQKRQTPRSRIALNDIIFPYIRYENPEFQRVHDFMRAQVLTPEDIADPDAPIKTKGVFKGLTAHVGGLEFVFGTGGVHASVEKKRFQADDLYSIEDIDVEGLYPAIARVNRLAPAHLGEAFIIEYAKIPVERKTHKKGTYMNGALKLAANGPWGQSINKHSIFFDPQYGLTIPINGQLMLCMLVEQLVKVPTLSLIQANTDGVTYHIRRDMIPQARAIEQWWQEYTLLTLEYAEYSRMWIRDVNNYIAEPIPKPGSNEPVAYKQKGAYWTPDPFNYAESISTASPPCWYKDLGNIVSIRAAIAAMTQGIDPETYIRFHTEPHDFMLRIRARGQDRLELGGMPTQQTLRYYVSTAGAPLVKIAPAKGPIGAFKKANGVPDALYAARMIETGGAWCETVCTKNKSTYDIVRTAIEAGWLVKDACDISAFRYDDIDYRYYIAEARKLIVD